jgi:hypothetical protein
LHLTTSDGVPHQVVSQLRTLGHKLGTNDHDGTAERHNFLGVMALNEHMWPEVPWHGIALSAPTETHAWARPILVRRVATDDH